MKKTHIFLVSLASASMLLASCKSYLAEENPCGVTAETFYATESGAESGVKSCYSFLRLYYGKEQGYHMSEIGTDIFTGANGITAPEMDRYNNQLNGTSSTVTALWKAWYLALNTCNELIDKLPGSVLAESTKKVRLGEVHFLRALYLWQIVSNWGNVVLNETPTTSPSNELHRSTEEDFYKVIKEDLEYAIENLPVTQADYGRATRGAAQALSVRIYLTLKDWSTALEYAQAVIGSGTYALAEDYNQLVDMATCNSVKENIFVCNYASQANNLYNNSITEGPDGENMTIRNGGNNAHMFFNMVYDKVTDRNGQTPVKRCVEYGRPFNRFMPTLFYLDLFDETIDARYDACFRQAWICNNKTNLRNVGDTAIVFTKHEVDDAIQAASPIVIFDRSDVYNADGSVNSLNWNTAFKKFDDPTRGATNDQHSGRDCVIIRLAEMYLAAAEAYMQLNQKDKAAEMLNVVRRRAAIPGHEKEMECKAGDVNIDFILDERARELGGEMMRWQDLKRTGKLIERVKAHNNAAAPEIQEYHLLRPIPLTTLDAVINSDEFRQNPGYNS